MTPLLAFVKTPAWDQAETTTKEAFAELTEFLGDSVDPVAACQMSLPRATPSSGG